MGKSTLSWWHLLCSFCSLLSALPASEHAALRGKAINHHYCCLLPLRLLGQSVSDPLMGHSALSNTLFHLSSPMKGIYEPVVPALHLLTVSDWHSSPSRLTFTNLSASCALKSCYFAVYFCSIQKQFFSMHLSNRALWGDVRKHARRCLICSILPEAAVTEKQDWHWCWWVMVYVNGWMGLIGISRSATAACQSESVAEGLWEHKLNRTDTIKHLRRFRLTEKLPC